MEEYPLEKWIWTEEDFAQMGWHDATIYGIRLGDHLELDIDYIFQWNKAEVEGFYFTFWVAPCTLVFEKPKDLRFELTSSFSDTWLEIQDISLDTSGEKKAWTIIAQQGDISFQADSYKQIVRKRPSLQVGQAIPYDERDGHSFDLSTGEHLHEELTTETAERRKKQLEDYQLAQRRFSLNRELEQLHEKRESGRIQTKDYLTEKKVLKEKINSLTFQLRGTRYEQHGG